MEEYFQSLHLIPNPESTDPGILKLESQFLDLCSTYNVVQSALYIVPAYHDGKFLLDTWSRVSTKDSHPNLFLL